MAEPKLKLMNFVTASQTDAEIESVPSETQQKQEVYDDRPLHQILKENAEKKDAEFNERFKHRPPKALDEDETEFLDALETYRKQQEQDVADDEARELTNFHTAIANRTITTEEVRPSTIGAVQSEKPSLTNKRPQPKLPLAVSVKIKSQPKKARTESPPAIPQDLNVSADKKVEESNCFGLVAYSDESDDE
ncbi:hypothetical protein KC19_7G054200 [Ceratodon purpureus]|uniref:FAM192A/Fyv6 N-terminal domain-containing protein n=1 Tax=Ceratodon purpureus TaxID=3225 RepID=A0A8T0H4Y3_CERPU|nr:hypothetical protein KC19_7G054200 [Ceratodon purpureus]